MKSHQLSWKIIGLG